MAGSESSVEDIISGAVQEAGLAEMSDTGELVGTDESGGESGGEETTPNPSVPEGEGTAAPVEGSSSEEETEIPPTQGSQQTPTEDELDKELSGLGLQARDGKGQESRIRYSKVRKIWDNYKKKYATELTKQHEKTVQDLRGQMSQHAEKLQYLDNVNRLIATDKRRYLELLVMAQPEFRQFLNPAVFGGGQAAGTTQPVAQDEMPGPDAQYQDGSRGYTPEGFKKVLEWQDRQTQRRIEEKFQKQFGAPLRQITERERMDAERQMHAASVQRNVSTAKQIYGKAFTDDFGELGAIKPESQILKLLKENAEHVRLDPRTPRLGFLEAVALVCIPNIQADRNKMREELLAETQTRPAAARRSTPAASTTTTAPQPEGTEAIIAAEMRKAGML